MTQIKNLTQRTGRFYTTLGVCMTMAITATAPLFAQGTVVQGKAKRSDVIEQRVYYADLNLENRANQLVLISRVKKAAGKVCDIIHSGESPMMKFDSGCTYDVYRNAKPQIAMAIASADSGARVAINLSTTRSK